MSGQGPLGDIVSPSGM